jgi:hypothetical protein
MFKKNDPLVDAVKKIMESNERDRQVTAKVNEELGIQSRAALPREYQANYDSILSQRISETILKEQNNNMQVFDPISGSRRDVDSSSYFSNKIRQTRDADEYLDAKAAATAKSKSRALDTLGSRNSHYDSLKKLNPDEAERFKRGQAPVYREPNPGTRPSSQRQMDGESPNADDYKKREERLQKDAENNAARRNYELKKAESRKKGTETEAEHRAKIEALSPKFTGANKAPSRSRASSGATPRNEEYADKLIGKQREIDANNNGEIDAHDFKLLRKGVKPVAEEEQLDEISKKTLNRATSKAYDKVMKARKLGDTAEYEKRIKQTTKFRQGADDKDEKAKQLDELTGKGKLGAIYREATKKRREAKDEKGNFDAETSKKYSKTAGRAMDMIGHQAALDAVRSVLNVKMKSPFKGAKYKKIEEADVTQDSKNPLPPASAKERIQSKLGTGPKSTVTGDNPSHVGQSDADKEALKKKIEMNETEISFESVMEEIRRKLGKAKMKEIEEDFGDTVAAASVTAPELKKKEEQKPAVAATSTPSSGATRGDRASQGASSPSDLSRSTSASTSVQSAPSTSVQSAPSTPVRSAPSTSVQSALGSGPGRFGVSGAVSANRPAPAAPSQSDVQASAADRQAFRDRTGSTVGAAPKPTVQSTLGSGAGKFGLSGPQSAVKPTMAASSADRPAAGARNAGTMSRPAARPAPRPAAAAAPAQTRSQQMFQKSNDEGDGGSAASFFAADRQAQAERSAARPVAVARPAVRPAPRPAVRGRMMRESLEDTIRNILKD